MAKPTIAITMGDAAGTGPELIVRVLSQRGAYDSCFPLVVGDAKVMRDIARVVDSDLRFRAVASLSDAEFSWPSVDVLCPAGVGIDHIAWGAVDPAMGKAAGS